MSQSSRPLAMLHRDAADVPQSRLHLDNVDAFLRMSLTLARARAAIHHQVTLTLTRARARAARAARALRAAPAPAPAGAAAERRGIMWRSTLHRRSPLQRWQLAAAKWLLEIPSKLILVLAGSRNVEMQAETLLDTRLRARTRLISSKAAAPES